MGRSGRLSLRAEESQSGGQACRRIPLPRCLRRPSRIESKEFQDGLPFGLRHGLAGEQSCPLRRVEFQGRNEQAPNFSSIHGVPQGDFWILTYRLPGGPLAANMVWRFQDRGTAIRNRAPGCDGETWPLPSRLNCNSFSFHPDGCRAAHLTHRPLSAYKRSDCVPPIWLKLSARLFSDVRTLRCLHIETGRCGTIARDSVQIPFGFKPHASIRDTATFHAASCRTARTDCHNSFGADGRFPWPWRRHQPPKTGC